MGGFAREAAEKLFYGRAINGPRLQRQVGHLDDGDDRISHDVRLPAVNPIQKTFRRNDAVLYSENV